MQRKTVLALLLFTSLLYCTELTADSMQTTTPFIVEDEELEYRPIVIDDGVLHGAPELLETVEDEESMSLFELLKKDSLYQKGKKLKILGGSIFTIAFETFLISGVGYYAYSIKADSNPMKPQKEVDIMHRDKAKRVALISPLFLIPGAVLYVRGSNLQEKQIKRFSIQPIVNLQEESFGVTLSFPILLK